MSKSVFRPIATDLAALAHCTESEMKIDSTVFSTSIAAEVAELNAKLLALCQNEFETESKWFHIGPEEYRKKRAEGLTAFPKPVHLPRAKNIQIPSRDEGRNIKLRCFIPEGKILGIYLHMHGGGWVLSDAAAQDPYLSRLSESGMIAASIEYRLAPENPSPAAQDDCFDVAHYLLSPSSMSVFAQSAAVRKNIILGGESAGGHLALSTIISLQKKHRQSVAGVILNYGFYDLSLTPSARNCTAPLVLNNRDLEEFVKAYLPNKHKSISELQRPEHSPLYADLHGLCPAFFSCGTVDPLLVSAGRTALHCWLTSLSG